MKKLTVVVTTYNQEKFIKQALDSFVAQETNFPFEVLVCDDNSTDNTKKIIQEYATKYHDIVTPIYNEKNKGPVENFIFTLSHVKSQYVALCDGDDYWTDIHKLQKQVDFLDNNTEYSICFHRTKIFFERKDMEEQIYPTNIADTTDIIDLISLGNYIPANSVVYRWAFRKEGELASQFPKDIVPGDYYLHLLHAKRGKIKYMNEVMSHYRRHQSGMWWLTATPQGKEKFYLTYGKQYLKFYDAVENNLKIEYKYTKIFKKDIIYNTIISFIKNGIFDELYELRNSEINKKIFNENMLEIINRNNLYSEYIIHKEEEQNTIEKQKQEIIEEQKLIACQKQEVMEKKKSFDEYYYRLNKFQKIIYLLLIDKAKRREKIQALKDRYKKNR